MESPTSVLSEEHKNILRVVSSLINKCEAIESGKPLDNVFFVKAIDFIRNYADGFHHAKEEDILFKELCMDGVQMRCNPVDQMLHEHDMGRKFVKGMEEGMRKSDSKKIMENARGYAHLLQEHIYKEDNILFPMAEEALNTKTRKKISEEFIKAERKRFGKGTGEKYVALSRELERMAKK